MVAVPGGRCQNPRRWTAPDPRCAYRCVRRWRGNPPASPPRVKLCKNNSTGMFVGAVRRMKRKGSNTHLKDEASDLMNISPGPAHPTRAPATT
jgi:hypothetical protein